MKVILTGSTGMVGEGILGECLNNPLVEQVLLVNRKISGITHPKLHEVLHPDFYDITPIAERLRGYDACFFCLGVSSVGMKEADYYKTTYTLTLSFAKTLSSLNPGMTFCYVSGSGTDSSEKGRLMWARIKGKTENDLMKLPFKAVYNFRPAILKPSKGARNVLPIYKYFGFLYPVLRPLFPGFFLTLRELGKAMIRVSSTGAAKQVLEPRDILALGK